MTDREDTEKSHIPTIPLEKEPDDVTTAKREWSASNNYDRVAEVTNR